MSDTAQKIRTNTSHTPGPWEISNQYGDRVLGATKTQIVADCQLKDIPDRFIPSDDERLANARLIAAAPELLEALKDVLQHVSTPPAFAKDSGEVMQAVRAAIAKAGGNASENEAV